MEQAEGEAREEPHPCVVWALWGGGGAVCPVGTCPPWALGPPCGPLKQDSGLKVLLLEHEFFHDGQLFLVPLGLPFQIQHEAQKPTTPTIHDKQTPELPRAASRVQWEGQHHTGLRCSQSWLGSLHSSVSKCTQGDKSKEKYSSGIGRSIPGSS